MCLIGKISHQNLTSAKEAEFPSLKTAKCRKADKKNIRADGKYCWNNPNRLQFPLSSLHCPTAALSNIHILSSLGHNPRSSQLPMLLYIILPSMCIMIAVSVVNIHFCWQGLWRSKKEKEKQKGGLCSKSTSQYGNIEKYSHKLTLNIIILLLPVESMNLDYVASTKTITSLPRTGNINRVLKHSFSLRPS